MKIRALIAALQSIEAEHGDVDVLMTGWNDTGHVAVSTVNAEACRLTLDAHDGEAARSRVLVRDLADGRSSAATRGEPFTVAVIENGY